MKLFVAQLNPTVGAVSKNLSAMLKVIDESKAQGIQIVIFSELAVSGYPPKDLLYYSEFLEECFKANEVIAGASDKSLLIIWGNITKNTSDIGKPLYNAALAAWNGSIIAKAHKTHLPTYDVFDEARYFEPGNPAEAVTIFSCFDKSMALTVCEDLWSHSCLETQEKAEITPVKYSTKPLNVLENTSVDYLFNISASPYFAGKPAIRCKLLKHIASMQKAVLIYSNSCGASDDLIFDGHSAITWPNGRQWIASGFKENVEYISLGLCSEEVVASPLMSLEDELIEAIIMGIRDYVNKTGFKKVFIGVSGGIDSALTAVLATKALGIENVIGISMPGPYSSACSMEDAQILASNLGIELRIFSIQTLFQSFLNLLSNGKRLADLAEENLQARLRGIMLMTLANREKALVLATGNKSEQATGYSTLYGDTCGALAPIGDLYKTEIYKLASALNKKEGKELIPVRIITRPPSAELAPNQRDEDTLPPYKILDKILKGILEEHLGFYDLLRLGYDKHYVLQTLQRVMSYEYKRQQMPLSLKVSPKAFGSGRAFPVVHQAYFPLCSKTDQV